MVCKSNDIQAEVPILDVIQVSQLERAIEAAGTSLAVLMDRAGTAVADAVHRRVTDPCNIAVLVGSGNNGGDGWVAAKLLADAGYYVTLATTMTPGDLRTEPARTTALSILAHTACNENNLRVLIAPSVHEVTILCKQSYVIVDALLGTGFSGKVLRNPLDAWVDAINTAHAAGVSIIAADVPSGLSAQTGLAANPCVSADETITMLTYKPGLLLQEARTYVGTLRCATLGIDVRNNFPEFI